MCNAHTAVACYLKFDFDQLQRVDKYIGNLALNGQDFVAQHTKPASGSSYTVMGWLQMIISESFSGRLCIKTFRMGPALMKAAHPCNFTVKSIDQDA